MAFFQKCFIKLPEDTASCLYIWNKKDRTAFIWTVVFIYFFPCTANFFSSTVHVTNEIIKLSKQQNGQIVLLCKIVKFF